MKRAFAVAALLLLVLCAGAKNSKEIKNVSYKIVSPDGSTTVTVNVKKDLWFSVERHGDKIVDSAVVNLNVNNRELGKNCRVMYAKESSADNMVTTPLYKFSQVKEAYNQLDLSFWEGFGAIFRVYDDGVAYRLYHFRLKAGDTVMDEQFEVTFHEDGLSHVAYSTGKDNQFQTSFENRYTVAKLSEMDADRVAFNPLMVSLENGMHLLVTDADIQSYPGMFLKKAGTASHPALKAVFAHVPEKVEVNATRKQEKVSSYTDVMVRIDKSSSWKAPRYFPWRALVMADTDSDLLTSNLVYLLGEPNRIGSTDWIRPGKVAWDWWNDWGLTGVDFRSGINTETYKYYIDFASKAGVEYVILDEGWSNPKKGDIMSVIPEIDLPELVRYADSRNVGLILWTVAFTLDKKLEEACKYYSQLGIKGFKVDFIDRDDQDAVEMVWRIAAAAASQHMMVDFHGMYKPAGFNRTYPNVVNFEGVWGLEQMKWSNDDMVSYDVTFPFIRMASGPVDYTQGAMRNASKKEYKPNYSNPMSQGTRARQVAEYVIFESPLAMLCDSPSAYLKEMETVGFITSIPTVWDETRALQAEAGEYVVMARRKGDTWYLGGLSDWNERDVELDIRFIGKAEAQATIFKDGKNAQRSAQDYKLENKTIDTSRKFRVHMAPGGGFAAIIK